MDEAECVEDSNEEYMPNDEEAEQDPYDGTDFCRDNVMKEMRKIYCFRN